MDIKEERKALRKILRSLKASIEQPRSSPFLSDADLKKLDIQQKPLSLEGTAEPLPLFFEPYAASIPPTIDTLDYYPELDDSPSLNTGALVWYLNEDFEHCIMSKDDPPGSYYTDFGDFGFGILLNTWKEPRWKVKAAWDLIDKTLPHMKALMCIGAAVPDDGPLFEGELLVIIDIIGARLKSFRSHVNAPVLLFSVLDVYVRVLEAFFDDGKLVVRKSKLYNMKTRDHERFIQLSRWWLGYASKRSTVGPSITHEETN